MTECTWSCLDVLGALQCYVDCECDAQTMCSVARHLDRCAACRAEVEMLRWLKAAVRRCAGPSGYVGRRATAPELRPWP